MHDTTVHSSGAGPGMKRDPHDLAKRLSGARKTYDSHAMAIAIAESYLFH